MNTTSPKSTKAGLTLLTTVLLTTIIVASITIAVILVTLLTSRQAKTQVSEKQIRYLTEGVTQAEIMHIIDSDFTWPGSSINQELDFEGTKIIRSITEPRAGVYQIDITSQSEDAARRLRINHDRNPKENKIVILLDTSLSMDDQSDCTTGSCQPITKLTQAAAQLVTKIRDNPIAQESETSLYFFNETAILKANLGGAGGGPSHIAHHNFILNQLTSLPVTIENSSNLEAALIAAESEFPPVGHGGCYIIVMTDGLPNRRDGGADCDTAGYPTSPNDCTNEAANRAMTMTASNHIELFVISPGITDPLNYSNLEAGIPDHNASLTFAQDYLANQIASKPEYAYFDSNTDEAIKGIFNHIYINNAFSIEELPPEVAP